MIPQTRTDLFLAKITGEDVTLPVPQTRFELYLANIAGESYELPAPNSRATLYLAKILGDDVELPVPQTRSELYLASIAGMSVQLPEVPTTREEWYLARWAEDAGYVTITGNPVSFNAVAAKLRQLKVAFSPVQNLHGYDAPWPAGGGANKLPSFTPGTYTATGLSVTVDNDGYVKITRTSGGSGSVVIPFSEPFIPVSGMYFHQNSVGDSLLYDVLGLKDENGSIYNVGYPGEPSDKNKAIPENAVGKTITGLRYYINSANRTGELTMRPSADYTATAPAAWTPYSNECPISGWTGVNVWQAGKNLFDKSSAGISDGWWYAPDLVVGEPLPHYAGSNNYHTSAPIPVVAGQTLTVVGCGGGNGSFLYLDKDMNYLDGFANASQSSRTFTVPNNPQIAYLRFPFATSTVDTCQLELGSAASAYEPYDDQLIPVAFGDTYYSGSADVLAGKLAADMDTIDLGDLNWTYREAQRFFTATVNGYRKPANGQEVLDNLCTIYKQVSLTIMLNTTDLSNNAICCGRPNSWDGLIIVRNSAYTDADVFKAAMSGVTYCYELAEPLEIQLTPQQISSLAGPNTMWSDANGDLTVEYRKDGNVSDAEALSMLLGGRYTPATGPEDVSDSEALSIITGR